MLPPKSFDEPRATNKPHTQPKSPRLVVGRRYSTVPNEKEGYNIRVKESIEDNIWKKGILFQDEEHQPTPNRYNMRAD